MNTIKRRDFLKGATATVAAAGLASCATKPKFQPVDVQPIGANEDIRMGVIGFRGQGGGHIRQWLRIPGVRLVALCDPDERVLMGKVRELDNEGIKVKAYKDCRDLINDPEIDAISTATPNHWHSLISVWACQAGKDAYIEKPISHNVWEGRQAVLAARKYNRIVQSGTQNRSDASLAEALRWLQEGNLGKITLVRGLCYKRRASIGQVDGPQPIPEHIDYDLWTGPAPMKPLMRRNLHYDWHWIYDYGNGDVGNQGIHQMDICRWAAGHQTISPRVMSIGGRVGYEDDGETPNTQYVFHDYDDIPIIFEVQGLPMEYGMEGDTMNHYKGVRVGNVVHCEGGYFAGGWAYDNDGERIRQFRVDAGEGHYDNFINAMRSRKQEELTADILEGHLSSALCHTGLISHMVGETATEDEIREVVTSIPESLETFERMKEHLVKNRVDINVEKLTIGPWLKCDVNAERFSGGFMGLFAGSTVDKANALISREYREPFVVPKNV